MRKVVILFSIIMALLLVSQPVFSVECQSTDSKDSSTLQEIINACNSKLGELSEQRNTLASQIEYMDTQISVTQLEINQNLSEIETLKKEIKNLGSRITELNTTTDKIAEIVKLKIERMYKRQQSGFLYTLMSANNLPKFLRSIQYLRRSQISDRELLLKLQNTKVTFVEQKDLREEKEEELNQLTNRLESYKVELASQQQAKEYLLEITENDEKMYQNILARAKAEFEAIQIITSGGGSETMVKDVGQGEKIASVIPGQSACSGGTHLHFEVVDNGTTSNPANYLTSKSVSWELCGWYGCDQSFSFSGSNEWPLNDPIIITQPFGLTEFAKASGMYPTHTGIDMYSTDLTVKAVKNGKLYKGSISCGGGNLLYVKVESENNFITYYLHVYP